MQGGRLLNRKNVNLTAGTYSIEKDKTNKNNNLLCLNS